MSNVLTPTPVSARQFTYDPATRWFVAEASDLPALGRVYDDACDVGLTLVGNGYEIVYAVDEEKRDAEGELQVTILRPVRVRGFYYGATETEVHVLND